LYRVYKHSTGCQTRLTTGLTTGSIVYTAGCQTGCTNRLDNPVNEQWLFVQHGCQNGCQTGLTTGLTTGGIVQTNIQPVVKPVVPYKRGNTSPVAPLRNVLTGCRNVTQRHYTHGTAFSVNTLSLVNVYDLRCAWHGSNQAHLLKYTSLWYWCDKGILLKSFVLKGIFDFQNWKLNSSQPSVAK